MRFDAFDCIDGGGNVFKAPGERDDENGGIVHKGSVRKGVVSEIQSSSPILKPVGRKD